MVEEEVDLQNSMSALTILTCRQNSHPFQERHISLHEPAKIGRSVARARPAPNNGIFDCKVLSRNHAMLWYENGIWLLKTCFTVLTTYRYMYILFCGVRGLAFYLQDTKSSNGTFINDQRLCKGGEESAPRECYSGDVIQFGVNVMENNRRGEKITHGCIIATITLYHPDGREAKPVLYNTPTPGITIQSQELYKLAQYLQEALHREKMLEQKLSNLQELVQNTQESSEGGWQALIDEDRLLSRLEVLENQLHVYSKNHAEDTLRQELVTLQEEKLNYESTAKDSLMKVLQEKIEAVSKLSDLEKSLNNAEEECTHLKDSCEKTQEELQLLAEKYQDQLKEVQDLQIQLQDAESKYQEDTEKTEKEKVDLTEKINDMIKQEAALTAKVESLQANADIASEQLTTMKARLEKFKDVNEDENENNMKMVESDQEKSNESDSEVIIPTSVDKDQLPEDVEGKLKETQQQIETYKSKMEDSEKHLKESSEKVEQLQKELNVAKLDSAQYMAKIEALEGHLITDYGHHPRYVQHHHPHRHHHHHHHHHPDQPVEYDETEEQIDHKLKVSELHMNQMMENTMVDLNLQLNESTKQSDSSNDLIKNLQNQIIELEQELALFKIPQPEKLDTTLVCSTAPDMVDSSKLPNHVESPKADEEFESLLREARELQKKAEEELSKCRVDLEDSQLRVQKSGEENSALKTELEKAHEVVTEKSGMVIDLQDQLQKAEATTQEVKQQILTLRDQLLEEQELSKVNLEEINSLKGQLDIEKKQHKDTQESLEESKKLLTETQQSAKQSHNEAEQLRNKLRHHEDSEVPHRRDKHEKRESHPIKHSHHTPDSKHPVGKTKANEFTALKEECASLRKRIQAIEAEMKMSRRENLQLSSEYNKLQESYRELEELKDKLEDKQTTWMSNLTDSQKETENTKLELETAKEEISTLKKKCEDCEQEVTRLKSDLQRLSGDYGRVATRSRIISFCSSIPLLMLLFAILLALYPALEQLTATAT